MRSQQFLGRGQLINRLAMQVGSRETAIALLQKRGHLEADGKTFTPEGERRNLMTAEERAKDRASKRLDKPVSDFSYNPRTNTAKIIKNI
jgi:hypothetical protein